MELNQYVSQAHTFVTEEARDAAAQSMCRPASPPAGPMIDLKSAPGISAIFLTGVEQPYKAVAVIPAHNEDRFIASVVLKTRRFVDAVIVVDDGSQDMTGALAQAAGAMVVTHERNLGKSAAINTGLRVAQEMAADIAVLLDGDGQHHPEDIPHLIQPVLSGEADIVVGSRFIREGNRIPRWRVFGQHTLTAVTNVLSGISLTDSQSGFRVLSSRAIAAMYFGQAGFTVESEMQFQAQECGLTIIEAPIGVTYAEGPKRNPVAHALQVINGVLRLAGQHRPLLFFGVPGVALLAIGTSAGLRVVAIYQASQDLAIGHALLAVLVTILGTLSLFLGISLHSIRGLLLQVTQRQRNR